LPTLYQEKWLQNYVDTKSYHQKSYFYRILAGFNKLLNAALPLVIILISLGTSLPYFSWIAISQAFAYALPGKVIAKLRRYEVLPPKNLIFTGY